MEPMNTALKDGTHLLLYFKPGPDVLYSGWIEGWWFSSPKEIDDDWETIIGSIGEPTGWLALPEEEA